jgi:hypothetical protein
MGPDAPVWALVVCPARREPAPRQPEQYALDLGPGKISSAFLAKSPARVADLVLPACHAGDMPAPRSSWASYERTAPAPQRATAAWVIWRR